MPFQRRWRQRHHLLASEHRHAARFIRSSALVSLVRASNLILVFLVQLLLARLLASENEYGIYAWGQSLLFMVGTLAAIGLHTTSARYVAALRARGEIEGLRAIIRHALRLLARSSLALMLSAAMIAVFYAGTGNGPLKSAAVIAIALAPTVSFSLFFKDIYRAQGRLLLSLLPSQVLRPLLTASFALLLWQLGSPALDGKMVLALVALSLMLATLIPAISCLREHRGKAINTNLAEYHPGGLLRTALPIFLNRCANLCTEYSNILVIGFLLGPAAAGLYFAAERLSMIASIPRTVASTVNQPEMAAAHATADTQRLRELIRLSLHGALWPTLLACVLLSVLSKPLLGLFGETFVTAATTLSLLAFGQVVHTLFGPAQDLLLMTGRQASLPRITWPCMFLHLLLLLFFLPTFGILGAALATLGSTLISGLLLTFTAARKTGYKTRLL